MTASEEISSEEESEEHEGFQLILLLIPFGLLLGTIVRYFQYESANLKYLPSLPFTVILLLAGIALGFGEVGGDMGDLGTAVNSIKGMSPHLLLGAFIPPLIFESAFGSNFHIMYREKWQALLLAGPGVLINSALTAIFVYYVFPYDWNWAESIVFGAIVSATDPVAVVALLRDLGASKRLATLIEGESLLNDGTAFVLYMIALEFVKGTDPSAGDVIGSFCQLTFGGIFTGILFALLTVLWLQYVISNAEVEITITILVCYLCFHVAEIEFETSGVLAVVFLGLVLSKYKCVISPAVEHSMHHVWQILGFIANTLIFLFGGIIVALGVFEDETNAISGRDWGYLIAIYLIIHVTKLLTLVILWIPLKHLGYGITVKNACILVFGGLRGVIGLALALITRLESLSEDSSDPDHDSPHHLRFKDQIMFHVSGIVFLTLVINATAMKYIVQGLGLNKSSETNQLILKDAMHHLRLHTQHKLFLMKGDLNFSGAAWNEVMKSLPSYAHLVHGDNNRKCDDTNEDTISEKKHIKIDSNDDIPMVSVHAQSKKENEMNKYNIISDDVNDIEDDDGGSAKKLSLPFFHTDSIRSAIKGKKHASKRLSERYGIAYSDIALAEDISRCYSEPVLVSRKTSIKSTLQPIPSHKEIFIPSKATIFSTQISTNDENEAKAGDTEEQKKCEFNDYNIIDLEEFESQHLEGMMNTAFVRTRSLGDVFMNVLQHSSADNMIMDENMDMDDQFGNETKAMSPKFVMDGKTKKAFIHRILTVMKMSYISAFEEDVISMRNEMVLVNAADYALDDDDLDCQYKHIRRYFQPPFWMKYWYEKQILSRISYHILFNFWSNAIQMGVQFIHACEHVEHFIFSDMPRISSSNICDEILDELQRHSKLIKDEMYAVQDSYPEIYAAVQTMYATKHLLHCESKEIDELLANGLLEESEYKRMHQTLSLVQHKLHYGLMTFYNVSREHESDDKQVLLNLQFMEQIKMHQLMISKEDENDNDSSYQSMVGYLVSNSDLHICERGDHIFQSGEFADHMIVIVRGTAVTTDIRSKGKSPKNNKKFNERGTYKRGSILLYAYLLNSAYMCDCIAKTKVIYYKIARKIMDQVLENELQARISLWKQAATNLICGQFAMHFGSFKVGQKSEMCQKSRFKEYMNDDFELNENCVTKTPMALHFKALLMDGLAINVIRNEILKAPCVLRGIVPYVFTAGTKLLIFDYKPYSSVRRSMRKMPTGSSPHTIRMLTKTATL